MYVRTVLAALLVALTSCGKYGDGYSCIDPDRGHRDLLNNPDPCHESDPDSGTSSSDAGETCDGTCILSAPLGWFGPYLLWVGDEADAPQCSDLSTDSHQIFAGRSDLDAPTHCDACACAPPTGTCTLPAKLTASAASCAGDGPGVAHTPFNPPPEWDGTCTSTNTVGPGKLCGGVPCVQSVTIAPLTLKESACAPIQPPNVQPPATWKKFARACAKTQPEQRCTAQQGMCMPAAPGTQFRQCISYSGEKAGWSECPSDYPDRSVFYHSFTDDRSCPACTCNPPAGSTCSGSVSMFGDATCGAPLSSTVLLDATGPACTDIKPAGSALGSKSASEPIYTPGQCVPQFDETTKRFAAPQGPLAWCCKDTP